MCSREQGGGLQVLITPPPPPHPHPGGGPVPPWGSKSCEPPQVTVKLASGTLRGVYASSWWYLGQNSQLNSLSCTTILQVGFQIRIRVSKKGFKVALGLRMQHSSRGLKYIFYFVHCIIDIFSAHLEFFIFGKQNKNTSWGSKHSNTFYGDCWWLES